MPISRDVANSNFAQFVKRQLEGARERGMTDRDIEIATGVTNSTFHRWQRGEFGRTGPSAESVRKFCDGLDIPRATAAEILGWSTDEPTRRATEPDLPPNIRDLVRMLRDPSVSERDKDFANETIKSLLARQRASARKP